MSLRRGDMVICENKDGSLTLGLIRRSCIPFGKKRKDSSYLVDGLFYNFMRSPARLIIPWQGRYYSEERLTRVPHVWE